MRLYTSQFGDSKLLIRKIITAHKNSQGKWLFLKDLDCGDKRANLGLFLHGECYIGETPQIGRLKTPVYTLPNPDTAILLRDCATAILIWD